MKNVEASRESRGLFYVRRPRELEGVAVWMGQHIVLLPPDGRDTTFYERIAQLIGRAENIRLQGDAYYWPTEREIPSPEETMKEVTNAGQVVTLR